MQPYQFSNGVILPRGTIVGAAVENIHMNDNVYENAKEFDGFRFSKLWERDSENPRCYAVNTSPDFLHFGHGLHAWYVLAKIH